MLVTVIVLSVSVCVSLLVLRSPRIIYVLVVAPRTIYVSVSHLVHVPFIVSTYHLLFPRIIYVFHVSFIVLCIILQIAENH